MSLLGIYVRFKQKNKYVPKKKMGIFFHFLHRKLNHCVRMNRTRYMYKLISTNEKSGITLTFFIKKGNQ